METQANDKHAGIVERLEAWWHDRKQRQREQSELSAFDGSLRDQLARDVGMTSVEELAAVVARGPRGAALMSEMAQALGVGIDELRARLPHVLREMEISCTTCAAKSRCSCELEAGTAASHVDEFCNNADAFASLKR